MAQAAVSLRGSVTRDGLLVLPVRLRLEEGPVDVTIQPAAEPRRRSGSLKATLERIWAEREASGKRLRTREEIDAQINAMRDEWEDRAQEIEALRASGARAREQAQ